MTETNGPRGRTRKEGDCLLLDPVTPTPASSQTRLLSPYFAASFIPGYVRDSPTASRQEKYLEMQFAVPKSSSPFQRITQDDFEIGNFYSVTGLPALRPPAPRCQHTRQADGPVNGKTYNFRIRPLLSTTIRKREESEKLDRSTGRNDDLQVVCSLLEKI